MGLFAKGKLLERATLALERLVILKQAELAHAYGVTAAFETAPKEEGAILYTDPAKIAELEERKERYAEITGIDAANPPAAVREDGSEWPPEAEGLSVSEQQRSPLPIEELLERERTPGGSSEGLLCPGPEGAESDAEAPEGGGSEEGAHAGHIPR
jgi:hypothetical protein